VAHHERVLHLAFACENCHIATADSRARDVHHHLATRGLRIRQLANDCLAETLENNGLH